MGRRGFTLIELLIVLGIIGILATIAIPRYYEIRERAYIATMQEDLAQLRLAQERYRVPPQTEYAESVDELGDSFTESAGVGIEITDSGPDDWAAEATHVASDRTCVYSSEDGAITCGEGGDDDGEKGAK